MLETPKDLKTPIIFNNYSKIYKYITMGNQQETKLYFIKVGSSETKREILNFFIYSAFSMILKI
jgi:hypothetical protein